MMRNYGLTILGGGAAGIAFRPLPSHIYIYIYIYMI